MKWLPEKKRHWDASNITNTRKFEIKTPDVVIQVQPEKVELVETRIIDGRKCLVIPMEDVEINGILGNYGQGWKH